MTERISEIERQKERERQPESVKERGWVGWGGEGENAIASVCA